MAYDWPGNVRELEHEVRRFVYQSDDGRTVDSTALSPEVAGSGEVTASVPAPASLPVAEPDVAELESLALEPRLRTLEEALIREALRRSGGNQTPGRRAAADHSQRGWPRS